MKTKITIIIERCLEVGTSCHGLALGKFQIIATCIGTYYIICTVSVEYVSTAPDTGIRIWKSGIPKSGLRIFCSTEIIGALLLRIVEVTAIINVKSKHCVSTQTFAPLPESKVLIYFDAGVDLVARLVPISTTDKITVRVSHVTVVGYT